MHLAFITVRWSRVAPAAWACTLAGVLAACSDQTDNGALEAVEWLRLDDAHCESKGGEMIAVRSTHPDRTVLVWLDRVYMGVKTGDRGHHRLDPGSAPLQLGCSATDGGTQRWDLVDAKFASD